MNKRFLLAFVTGLVSTLLSQNLRAYEIGDLVYREGLVGEGQPYVGNDPIGHTGVNCRKHKRSYRQFPPPFSSSAGAFY